MIAIAALMGLFGVVVVVIVVSKNKNIMCQLELKNEKLSTKDDGLLRPAFIFSTNSYASFDNRAGTYVPLGHTSLTQEE